MIPHRNQPNRQFICNPRTVPLLIRTLFYALAVSLSFALHTSVKAEEPFPNIPYILVDAADNSVLAENRMHERWHPASLTKLMTAYVTFKAIQAGEISVGSPVTFTKNAASTPPGKMGYREGTQLRFDMALYTLIVKSANDVAVAIAESVSGSVQAFVNRMNEEARNLGLANTQFSNPNGLHDPKQYVSARDLVILSSAIWNEFPQYRPIFETPTITAGDKSYTSYNLLLERFVGTTGMKTGFICSAGYNIVVSAERGGRRLVAVVLGSSSQTERAELSARLFLKGFDSQSGQKMSELPAPQPPTGPKDMRGILCTEQARQNRYDPASETAVIKSPYLTERRVTMAPVQISLGGIDGEPSPGWISRSFVPARVPIPTKRPEYGVVNVDGDVLDKSTLRGTFPLPLKSPRQSTSVQ
jgi:D-alanyl-D-alanine carboxypeptidase